MYSRESKIREVDANKFENAGKIDQFQENFNVPKLTQEEKEILNSPLLKELKQQLKLFLPKINEWMNK